MEKTAISNHQKAYVTEIALEVNNVLRTAFENAEIEINKLNKELPEDYGEEVDNIINKVYHKSVDLIEDIRNDILNLNLNEDI